MEYKPPLREELTNLRSRLDQVEGKKKEKTKKFKIPKFARLKKKHLKKGYITVQTIGENNNVNFARYPIEEGTIMVNGSPYIATSEYILNYKNKPFMILPIASIEPYNPRIIDEETTRNQTRAAGYKLILNRMKQEQIKAKSGGGWILYVIIGLALIGGIWYISKNNIF